MLDESNCLILPTVAITSLSSSIVYANYYSFSFEKFMNYINFIFIYGRGFHISLNDKIQQRIGNAHLLLAHRLFETKYKIMIKYLPFLLMLYY